MVDTTTKDRIIFSLVRNNGQTYTELKKSAKANHNTLAKTLKQLLSEKIIVKTTDNQYLFSFEVRNKVLKILPRAYDLAAEFEDFTRKLNEEQSLIKIFVAAELKLQELLRAQIMIKMERYASIKLTKRDKLEFDLYGDIIDGCIDYIFEIANKKSPQKTQLMKKRLYEFLAAK